MSQTANEKTYGEIALECDQLIKAGRISEAIVLIKSLNTAKVPRKLLLDLAKVCRRIGLIGHGLRLLHPLIRGETPKSEAATDSEKCEYSVLLVRNGSIQEALALLDKVDPSLAPEAWLYKSFSHIALWDYPTAVSYLENFLRSGADPYMKSIAQVNLASSLIVVGRLDEASDLLNATLPHLEKTGATRLEGNCHELWGQLHFWRNDFQSARRALQRALELLGKTPSYDWLLINKTEAIMSALESNSLDPLVRFRQEAVDRKHWESVRESDLFSLKVRFHQDQLDHLIFGTPLAPYRNRIQEVVGAAPSEEYILGSKGFRHLDLQTGALDDSLPMAKGKKIHHVIASLVRDFYSPRNVGSLFSELYPGEYFDTLSSPGRIRQLMLRTRQWLADQEIPATIEQSQGTYRLVITGEFGIKVALQKQQIDAMQLKWNELQSAFAGAARFTAETAVQRLSWSRTGFRRVVDWALAKGIIKKSGSARSTYYEFTQGHVADFRRSAS